MAYAFLKMIEAKISNIGKSKSDVRQTRFLKLLSYVLLNIRRSE
jgi:hypothetical protein